jgi:inhibitor of cysteine peptidase
MDDRWWHKVGAIAVVFVLVAALAAVAATGCSSANAAGGPLTLADTDNGKAFSVKVGDIITVVIPGNVTTGYSWAAALSEKDAALLQQQGEPVYADGSNETLVGAGGDFTFTFKAAAAGQAALKLVYARPWENGAPAQTYEVHVTIE